jgi:hypothetical protein
MKGKKVKVYIFNPVCSDIKNDGDKKENIINISLDGSMISDISQKSRNFILKDTIFHRSPDDSNKDKIKEEKPNILN